MPVAVEVAHGVGRVTVLATPFGVGNKADDVELANAVDQRLETPYPLLAHVRHVLDEALREQMLFEVSDGLGLVTCRKGPGEYTLGVFQQRPRSADDGRSNRSAGPSRPSRNSPLTTAPGKLRGTIPEGFENADLGANNENTIAGGDVRVFRVRVEEAGVAEIAQGHPSPTPRAGCALADSWGRLHQGTRCCGVRRSLRISTAWPWIGRYVADREEETLARESGWIERQGLGVYVDLTSGLNLFPNLRLADNHREHYEASMAAIEGLLHKMGVLGAQDLILSLHRVPENNFGRDDTWTSFEETIGMLGKTRGGTGRPCASQDEHERGKEPGRHGCVRGPGRRRKTYGWPRV